MAGSGRSPLPLIFGKSYCKYFGDTLRIKYILNIWEILQYNFLDRKCPPTHPPLELFRKFIRFGSQSLPSGKNTTNFRSVPLGELSLLLSVHWNSGGDQSYLCRYNMNGFVEELVPLPESRYGHACDALPSTGVRYKTTFYACKCLSLTICKPAGNCGGWRKRPWFPDSRTPLLCAHAAS